MFETVVWIPIFGPKRLFFCDLPLGWKLGSIPASADGFDKLHVAGHLAYSKANVGLLLRQQRCFRGVDIEVGIQSGTESCVCQVEIFLGGIDCSPLLRELFREVVLGGKSVFRLLECCENSLPIRCCVGFVLRFVICESRTASAGVKESLCRGRPDREEAAGPGEPVSDRRALKSALSGDAEGGIERRNLDIDKRVRGRHSPFRGRDIRAALQQF